MRRRCFVGGGMLAASAALAQRGEIVRAGDGKTSINLAGFRTGGDAASKTFLSVLKADLNRSGYFRVTSSGAAISVMGKAAAGSQIRAEVQVYNSASRQRVLGKAYTAESKKTRTLAHNVADAITLAVTGKPGMASARLALVGSRTGRKELYVCDMDGRGMQQVTRDRSIVVGPNWTPDAKQVVYTSYKRGYPTVYMTGRAKPLAAYGGLNAMAAVSPDGKQVALILSKDGNPELYVKSLRTGALRRLTKTKRGNEASPCWSPDGRRIAFVSDTSGRPHIYVIPAAGGSVKRLSSTGTENVAPDWGKNGMLTWCTRTGGKYRVVVADPQRRALRQLETDWADYEDPQWAPDGRHIVCTRTSNHRKAIYLLDTLKDSPVALISGSSDWFSPAVSP